LARNESRVFYCEQSRRDLPAWAVRTSGRTAVEVNMMRNLYTYDTGRMGVALLLIRAVVGTAFVLHGLPKVANPAAFAGQLGLPVWLGAVAAWTEVIGGGLLVLGLLTPLTALFLTAQMIGALAIVHLPKGDPFVNPGGASFELAAVYLAISVAYFLVGPGAYSLDALIARRVVAPDSGAIPRRERGII
jgi:putative oxidoreductase